MGRWYLRYVAALVALAAAGLVAVGEGAAAPGPDKMFSRSWNLKSNDNQGAFVFCTITARFMSGRLLIFSIDQYDRFSLLITDDDWKFETDSLHPATLSIDGQHLGDFELKVMTPDMILVDLPKTGRIFEMLKHGRQVDVGFMGIMTSFALTDTRAGLADLERCGADGMARAGGAHRESPPAQQAPGARQSAPVREPAPAPVAGTPEQIVSESWTVRDAGDESGDVSSPCMVLALYETTRALSFALNRYDRFALTIDSPVWKIEKEMRYPVTISVDGRDIGKFRISGSGDGMYLINLPYTDRVVEGLKNGLRLGVTVKETTLLYSLAGIRVALTDLERCVAQGTEAAEDWRRNPHLPGRQSDTRSSAPLAAGGTAAPGAPDKMISGSWELETLYRKNSGKFSYCRIDADYESSRSLAFTLDHVDRFKIMIYDPRWKLKSDAPYPSTLSIDDRDIGDYEAMAVDGVLYMISLPYTDDIVDAFKHGRQVAIDVDGETLRFGLAGTLVGLTDLERCVAEGGEPAKGVRRNPHMNRQPAPVAAARPKSAGAETRPTAPVLDQGAQVRADRRRFFNSGADDDWAFVNRLLDSVGLWDFEYVPRDEEKRRPIFYRWTNHLVAGGIIYFSLGNGTAFDEVRNTIENHDKNCDGAFDHTIREVKMASGAKAWRVFGSCSKAGEREVIAFLAFAYEGTGIYVTHIGLEAETDAIRDADNRMFGWFQATF